MFCDDPPLIVGIACTLFAIAAVGTLVMFGAVAWRIVESIRDGEMSAGLRVMASPARWNWKRIGITVAIGTGTSVVLYLIGALVKWMTCGA